MTKHELIGLAREKVTNDYGSVRKAAKSMGIDPGHLSHILNENIPIGYKTIERLRTFVAMDLTIDEDDIEPINPLEELSISARLDRLEKLSKMIEIEIRELRKIL